MTAAVIDIPESFEFLFGPERYIVAWGGRGSGKSVNIARCLLIRACQERLRVLCARELQASIRESVHKLLADEIDELGLSAFFEVQQTVIRGRNGSEFIFAGLKHNVAQIKSMQGINVCWVEEAQLVSKASWEVIVPTIREEGSQFYIGFNPELDTDETYKRFVLNPQPNSVVRKVNWDDNPYFPSTLEAERVALKERDPDAYLTVWEGHCRQALDGAVYADEIRDATQSGRIMRVPYDASKPVHTFWDLGWADNTSIWFAQSIGFEFRLIDYYQNSQKALPHYLTTLKDRGYVYGTDWLPHDASSRQMATGRSIEELMREAGRDVRMVPRLSLANGLNAARTLFGKCWFDETKCADGIQCLRHYRYETDPDRGTLKGEPLHDWASHGADAFRYFAIAMQEAGKPYVPKSNVRRSIA